MDPTTLLANTLSPGAFFFLFFEGGKGVVVGGRMGCLKKFFFPVLDANTRQDATQKLENASRDNYVCSPPSLCLDLFFC